MPIDPNRWLKAAQSQAVNQPIEVQAPAPVVRRQIMMNNIQNFGQNNGLQRIRLPNGNTNISYASRTLRSQTGKRFFNTVKSKRSRRNMRKTRRISRRK